MDKPVVIVTPQGASKVKNDLKYRGKEKVIKRLMKLLKDENGYLNVIDMHNVLDLFEQDEVTPFQSLNGIRVCVSWVGNPDGEIGQKLVPDMQARIKSGQISFGIVCSKRGKRPKKKKRTTENPDAVNRNICTEPGSKAYIINKLAEWSNCTDFRFFDDAKDHVDSVASLDIGVDTHLVPKGPSGIPFLVQLCNSLNNNS